MNKQVHCPDKCTTQKCRIRTRNEDVIMSDKKKHFNEDSELRIPDKLSEDLNTIFKSDQLVPHEIDRTIIDGARRYLGHRQEKVRVLRWFSSAAAAAAVILSVFLLDTPKQTAIAPSRPAFIAVKNDIDQNGSVDILDAFRLARYIDSAEIPDIKWDINGDGLVNHKDVDSVAFAAVRLDRAGVL